MSERCINPEEMADLHADDPRQAHLAECPRCQAVMKSFASFMEMTDVPAGAEVADAHARLSAALESEIGAGEFADPEGKVIRPGSGFWNPFRVRTLAAAAAVVIVAVGLSQVRLETVDPTAETVLRGVEAPDAAFQVEMSRQENGEFQVTWPQAEGATGYRVVIYGEDLEALAEFEVGTDLVSKFESPAEAVFCRVIAYRDGDELRKSEPVYFDDY